MIIVAINQCSQDPHSLSCMLHTGHLASEVRPHSWLGNGRKTVEGSPAPTQDSAIENTADITINMLVVPQQYSTTFTFYTECIKH